MRSLRTKLTIIVLGIFVVALVALGGLNYWKAREIITQDITSSMERTAANTAGDVGQWLESRKAELVVVSVAPAVLSGNPEAIVPFLINVAKANNAYDSIGFINSSGRYFSSSGGTGNAGDREYFRRAMQGETTVTDPVASKNQGHMVSITAVPVKADGKIIGVIYGAVDLARITEEILAVKIGQTGHAFVVQQNGLTIVHPDKEIAMKANSLQNPQEDPQRKALTERMVKGEKGFTAIRTEGAERFFAYAPVSGVKWSLALSVPVAEVTGRVSALTMISLTTIVVVLLAAILVITIFARRLVKPIVILEKVADRMADGDITIKKIGITANDEIGRLGQSFEKMAGNLHELIRQVSAVTDQVAASSEELSASAEQSSKNTGQVAAVITEVAQGAEKQLRAIEETASVVAQMSSSIQHVAASANVVVDTSTRSAEVAQAGSAAIERAVDQMGHIESTVNRSSQVVVKLGERSKEIDTIIETISGIAGQTNLLALNAAIEAARAGEAGRGFAVVAEEVRKLAEQSQEAAKQIAELIREIQQDTSSAVAAMAEGTRAVRSGAEVVSEAGQAFGRILVSFNAVTAQIKDITAAIQEIADGSQHIVTSVRGIDAVSKETAGQSQTVSAATQEQSASIEEIAASSQALAKMAEDLTILINKFKI